MHSSQSIFWGAVLSGLAVGIGAFAAHGLKDSLEASGYTHAFETGVKYHFYHALGLLATGILGHLFPEKKEIKAASLAMTLGIAIFSGSLYALSLTGQRWLGAITPIGGVGFIFAWAILAKAFFKNSNSTEQKSEKKHLSHISTS